MIYGIDPGFSGAIALYEPETRFLEVFDMPTMPDAKGKTVLDLHSVLEIMADEPGVVWIEKVATRPGQGISSAFRFGEQFGALQMAAAAQKLEVRFVTPAHWKKHFRLCSDKGVARGMAKQRFPTAANLFSRVKDDGRAEAALIALYGAEAL